MNREFARLKRQALLWVIAMAVLLAMGCILLFLLIQGPLAPAIVTVLQNVGHLMHINLYGIFFDVFANYRVVWAVLGYMVLLLIVVYIAFNRFTRYYETIGEGIDRLMEDNSTPIELPPDIAIIGKKLNDAKDALQKRLDDAEEAERRKNDLVMYLAHDIKTPLTSFIGYLTLLDEAQDMPIQQRAKYTHISLDKAHRLEQLIDEFFDITRFNLQAIGLNKEELNLTHMLYQMADEFYPMLEEHSLSIRVTADESIACVADPDKLARVFNNILRNAIAYSDPGTTIDITVGVAEDVLQVAFTNAGRTIPALKLETIFEKFYRLDAARTSSTGGAGLGLSIAREIIRAHAGEIVATSAGGVTTFTVTLPSACR